jgi:acyl-CoA reductase-like NAD-dependent aldehyde dehydrogenase
MQTSRVVEAKSRIRTFLDQNPLELFVGGQWVRATGNNNFATFDPGSGETLAVIGSASKEDVHAAVRAAQRAFHESGWKAISPNRRAVYLHRLADLVEQHRDELAEIESLDVGKPFSQARSDVDNFSKTMRYYADLSVHVQYREPIAVSRHEAQTVRQPYGVCGFIFPWNFPLLLAGWGIAPALAAGNTVVIKPAEDTSLSTLYLMSLVREAGIPDGVVNVVTGPGESTGAALANHPGLAKLSFTGSPEVGRLVAESCGRNLVPVKLELGGKGAAVVFDDVEIDPTAAALSRAITLNTGQVCCTASRWIVHEKIYDQFVNSVLSHFNQIRIGYWDDPNTEMGPLVSSKQRSRVLGYIDKGRNEGAEVLLEGGPADIPGKKGGFYVKPALLAGKPDNIACREEIFGPVPYLLTFRDEDEAVGLVNSSRYGLANSVWTNDLQRANRVAVSMVAGNSWINAHNVFPHGVPYGGVNMSGMGGGVLGPNTLFDYLRHLSVVRPL